MVKASFVSLLPSPLPISFFLSSNLSKGSSEEICLSYQRLDLRAGRGPANKRMNEGVVSFPGFNLGED